MGGRCHRPVSSVCFVGGLDAMETLLCSIHNDHPRMGRAGILLYPCFACGECCIIGYAVFYASFLRHIKSIIKRSKTRSS